MVINMLARFQRVRSMEKVHIIIAQAMCTKDFSSRTKNKDLVFLILEMEIFMKECGIKV